MKLNSNSRVYMTKPWEEWKLGAIEVDKTLYNLVISFTLLFVCVMILPHLPMDHYIEQLFYNSSNGEWVIDKENRFLRTIFYYGTKYSIAAFGVILIGVLILEHYKDKQTLDHNAILFVIICLAIIPSSIAFLKYLTGVPCPYQLQEYGGIFTSKGFLDFHFPDGSARPNCFPAGHPSGGFALLALAFVSKNKKKAIAIAVIFGVLMSFYQMARGAHFLSHCLVTLFFSLIIINIIYLKFLSFTSVKKPIIANNQLQRESYGQDQAI